jgi:hypothetical protein
VFRTTQNTARYEPKHPVRTPESDIEYSGIFLKSVWDCTHL